MGIENAVVNIALSATATAFHREVLVLKMKICSFEQTAASGGERLGAKRYSPL
jgi:hypothetical protein